MYMLIMLRVSPAPHAAGRVMALAFVLMVGCSPVNPELDITGAAVGWAAYVALGAPV